MEGEEEYGGYVRNNAWNYYHISNVNSQSNIYITLQQKEEGEGGEVGVMDCNLYVQADTLPSKSGYVYRDLSTNSVVQIPVISPMGRSWYVGIYAFHYCNYDISFSSQPQCGSGCEENGQCVEGVCECTSGWTGISCTIPMEVVGRGDVVSDNIGAGKWHYYVYHVPVGITITSVTASVREVSSSGFVGLYIKVGAKPTLEEFDNFEANASSDFHSVSVLVTSNQSRPVYIGVYGSPYIPITQPKGYKFGVYSPEIVFPNDQ